MNLLLQTLTALRTLATDALRAVRSDDLMPELMSCDDPQRRMAAQARNSMGLLSISGR